MSPEALGVDVAPRLKLLKMTRPSEAPGRGTKVGQWRPRLVDRLKNEAQGDLNMTVLVIAEHDNRNLNGANAE